MHFSKLFSFVFTLQVLVFSVCKSQNCIKPPKTILVSQTGNTTFKTIQSAIDSVPSGNSQWINIRVAPGTYRERVKIPMSKPCIYLEGAGREITSIEWDDHGFAHHSGTFTSSANDTILKGITFENTYNVLNESSNISIAVAAEIDGDRSAILDCGFIGVQDTLFDHSGRHYYQNCYIEGGFDFIFGAGQSIFKIITSKIVVNDVLDLVNGDTKECKINFSIGLGPIRDGVIVASERKSADDPSALVFNNCNITGSRARTELGRALEDHARVIIANSFLDDVIRPERWSVLSDFKGQESNILFVEVGNTGPGVNETLGPVPWVNKLSPSELGQFLNISFVDKEGWIANLPIKVPT